MRFVMWQGPVPTNCDVCGVAITNEFNDMQTTDGPWAIMCNFCAGAYGVGYGIGRGQHFVKRDNGTFVKDKG